MSSPDDKIPELPGIDLETTFGGAGITRFRNFVIRNLELIFILIIAFLVLLLFFFIPYKFAFLNLFYLPVLLAAYFLGKRKSLLASLHIILLVALTALIRPEWFTSPGIKLSTMVMISIWGGFLVLTSVIIGSLQERVS